MPDATPLPSEPRTPLSRTRILEVAVAYADEHGLKTLSMRRLAAVLGFKVMALYNHVASKDDMLDGAVDLVAAEIDVPAVVDADWQAALRHIAVATRQAFLRHPWAARIWSSRTPGPARLRYMEGLLRVMREGGLSPDLTYRAFHLLNVYILGFTLDQLNFQFTPEELDAKATDFLAGLPIDTFPWLTEHIHQHVEGHIAHDGEFLFGLDLLLAGLDQHRASMH